MIDLDFPALKEMAAGMSKQFPYPDDFTAPAIESVWVAVDDQDRVIAAVAAERILQLYLLPGELSEPAAKMHMLRLFMEGMGVELKDRGWSEVNAFLPPQIGARFGRRLVKSLGFVENWRSWCKRL